MKRLLLISLVLFLACEDEMGCESKPAYSGTIFIDKDIITSTDSSTFKVAIYSGIGQREMFDRRVDGWTTINAYLFNASFNDGLICEIQVNPEFGTPDDALAEALKYGEEIGRLPTVLRKDVETVWIHKGIKPFGGGNNNLLIHTGQAADYINEGILEETFVHEAAHTSLDSSHAYSNGWISAQNSDCNFISNYAKDYPQREDIAESFLPWLAVKYRSARMSKGLIDTILQTIPNRIEYFDNQSFDMYPVNISSVLNDTVYR